MKKYIGLEEMSNVNCAQVLSVIRDCGEVSRKQISNITGLSWGGMTKIVNKLFDNGYIVEEKSENVSGAGRTPSVIRVNPDYNFVIGLDINREGFSAYVMNLAGDVLDEYVQEDSFSNKEELLQSILGFTQGIVKEYENKKILAIGVAMQGILDVENGISIKFPHCPDWRRVPLKAIMEETFGFPVFVEHDPNCILYSCMSEEESENMLLFRLDSSVGMAAVVNGNIIRGNGLLEVAHCIVVPDGEPCRCGQSGCLEAYISACLVKGQLQEKGISQMIDPMAIVMSNMTRIFNADKVFLSGRLVKYREYFQSELLEKFFSYCDREELEVKFVDETQQAVHGAALIATKAAIEQLKI